MSTYEQLCKPLLRGPIHTRTSQETNPWSGRTTVASGDTAQVVSTSVVNSDSIILFGLESNTRVNSGQGGNLEVSSIVSQTSFQFAYEDGVNTRPGDVIAMWTILKPTDI
tara:strand:- start:976 stop:1305 length:330 start_codon:yes stop_codon:yes gene_type:complete